MFVPVKINTIIHILPQELINSNISDIISDKLINKFEGKCNKYGYIKKNSIIIIKRSYGEFIKEHFNAVLKYNILFSCEVCNPPQGSSLLCKVIATNNMGLKAEFKNEDDLIIEILIPRYTAGLVSDIDIETINIGDNILIEICGKRFNLNDTKIEIIGRVITDIRSEKLNSTGDEEKEEEDIYINLDNPVEEIDEEEDEDNLSKKEEEEKDEEEEEELDEEDLPDNENENENDYDEED
jgi:DNA-directed RNA polymerase subunit E'/Rpb7